MLIGARVEYTGNAKTMQLSLIAAGLTKEEFFDLYALTSFRPWFEINRIVAECITGTNQPLYKACNPTFALYDARDNVVVRWGHDGSVITGSARPLTPPSEAVGLASEDWNAQLVVAYADVIVARLKEMLASCPRELLDLEL